MMDGFDWCYFWTDKNVKEEALLASARRPSEVVFVQGVDEPDGRLAAHSES